MSNALAAVRFPDGLILHTHYHGASDIVSRYLSDETRGCRPGVEYPDDYRECDCGRDEAVEIATNYGGGSYWPGRACQHCRDITRGTCEFGYDYYDRPGWIEEPPEWVREGLPDWWPNA